MPPKVVVKRKKSGGGDDPAAFFSDDKAGGKKRKGMSAEDYRKLCPVDFNDNMEYKDMLEGLTKLMTQMLPVGFGAYMHSPKSTNAYAFGSLVEKFQALIDQMNDTVDYELLVNDLVIVFKETQRRLLLDLGSIIKERKLKARAQLKSKKSKKIVSDAFDEMYKAYGPIVSAQTEDLAEKIQRTLLEARAKKRK